MQLTVKVEAKSKFGFKFNGNWYNPQLPLKIDDFTLGNEYTVIVEDFTKKSGEIGHNVIKILPATVPSTAATTSFVPKARDFDAEARGKTLCKLCEAALGALANGLLPVNTEEELVERVKKIAVPLRDWVFEQQEGK